MAGLTSKQTECLSTIDALTVDGVPPSFAELRVALGLSSNNGVHRLIHSLRDRGYVSFMPRKARSLEVIRRPA